MQTISVMMGNHENIALYLGILFATIYLDTKVLVGENIIHLSWIPLHWYVSMNTTYIISYPRKIQSENKKKSHVITYLLTCLRAQFNTEEFADQPSSTHF